jgi:hypothetical protein
MSTTKTPRLETSKNYSAFIPNDEQRPIRDGHVKSLAGLMAEFGFLPSKPIQTVQRGTKYAVIDGHHRLAAAKSIGIPVFFVVEPESSAATMASVNAQVKTWGTADYVRMYAVRGLDDFRKLLQYGEVGIPLGMAASMLHGHAAASCNVSQAIKDGTFKIRETTGINKIYGMIKNFADLNTVVKHRSFIAALSDCLLTPEFDWARFERRFAENTSMMVKSSNKDLQLDQIEKLYNFRSQEKVPLAFLVKSNAAKRNAKAMGAKKRD